MHRMKKSDSRPCRRCGATPPSASFSMYTVAGNSYRHSWCLDCQRSFNREYKRKQRAVRVTGLGPRFGAQHPNAKLIDHDVLLIWGLIDAGLKDAAIAEKFEVSPNTIWSIRSGRAWAHCHPSCAASGKSAQAPRHV